MFFDQLHLRYYCWDSLQCACAAFTFFETITARDVTPNAVSESTVSHTELRESFWHHRVTGRRLSEFLSAAYYLCVKAKSPSFSQNSPSLPHNSVSSLFQKQYSRNSILPVSYFVCPEYRRKSGKFLLAPPPQNRRSTSQVKLGVVRILPFSWLPTIRTPPPIIPSDKEGLLWRWCVVGGPLLTKLQKAWRGKKNSTRQDSKTSSVENRPTCHSNAHLESALKGAPEGALGNRGAQGRLP